MRLLLDAGHGGRDSGTKANGITEADYVLELASDVVDAIAADALPVQVAHTRTEHVTPIDLGDRGAIGRAFGADLVVSLHVNAAVDSKAHGARFFFAPGSVLGRKVAEAMFAKVPARLRHKLGVQSAESNAWARVHAVLRHHRAPAVLVEAGFATNPDDAAALKDADVRRELVAAIVEGIRVATENFSRSSPSPSTQENV